MTAPEDSKARRQSLYAKREALRADQAERMARQEHGRDVANFHDRMGAALEVAGVRFEVLWSQDERRGPLTLYPIGFASIHWDLVPHAVSEYGGNDAWLKELLDEALRALGITPDTTLIVDWCLGGLPRLALSAADTSAHAIALMHCASDMWVYAADAIWVIEIHHDGKLTYADRPGLPEHAGDGWRPKRRGNRGRPSHGPSFDEQS